MVAPGTEIKLWVRPLLGEPLQLSMSELDKISDLKKTIERNLSIAQASQQLVHFGSPLEDEDRSLAQCGILDNDTLVLIKKEACLLT